MLVDSEVTNSKGRMCERWIKLDIVDVLINLCNIIIFIAVIIIFFWFIISKQFNVIILDKVNIITLLCQRDILFRNNIRIYMQNNNSIKKTAEELEKLRLAYNTDLLVSQLLPYIYAFGSLIVVCILVIVYKKRIIVRDEYILFLFIFLGFFTEVVFYFVVINGWKFIGDFELLLLLS
jgi:hypothetical protein